MISRPLAGGLDGAFCWGVDRGQSTLFAEQLEDWIDEDNPVRVIGIFVDE
jgi:hypothetical protein